MKFYAIAVLCICWPFFHISAQTKAGPKLVNTLDRGDYFFIPTSALATSVDGIIYQDKLLKKVPITNRPIELSWSSICNDGSYRLTITPEQIFFSSGHDNPNPNYLFWVIGIDCKRYESIRKGLAKNTPKRFLDLSKIAQAPGLFRDESTISYRDKFNDLSSLPAGWSDARYAAYCEVQLKQQLDAYFSVLNSYISDTQEKLTYPKRNSPKLFSSFKEEIKDWLPVKIRH